jgi:hypothetical protein
LEKFLKDVLWGKKEPTAGDRQNAFCKIDIDVLTILPSPLWIDVFVDLQFGQVILPLWQILIKY